MNNKKNRNKNKEKNLSLKNFTSFQLLLVQVRRVNGMLWLVEAKGRWPSVLVWHGQSMGVACDGYGHEEVTWRGVSAGGDDEGGGGCKKRW